MWTQAVTSMEKVTAKFEPGKSQNVNHKWRKSGSALTRALKEHELIAA
jgi:hypothetical protein